MLVYLKLKDFFKSLILASRKHGIAIPREGAVGDQPCKPQQAPGHLTLALSGPLDFIQGPERVKPTVAFLQNVAHMWSRTDIYYYNE